MFLTKGPFLCRKSLKPGQSNPCYDLNGNLLAFEKNLWEINQEDSSAVYLSWEEQY